MGITFYITILDIKCSFVGMYIDREVVFYKDLMLFPVNYILVSVLGMTDTDK